MNKQGPNGIEWTHYTWNVAAGCLHGCRWHMPDGSLAICYAETNAQGVARAAYRHGFEHAYWHEDRLTEPLSVSEPSRIFLDSMSDLMGSWNTDEQIRLVLGAARMAHWHTFQLLTKNAPRLLKFKDDFPPNLWVGCSMPPSIMKGRELTADQQARMFDGMAHVLDKLDDYAAVRWISFEPLSWDVSSRALPDLEWAVIGAASRGKVHYQPRPEWVDGLLEGMERQDTPVFFKGNLEWSPMRREWPAVLPPRPAVTILKQMEMFE